MEVGVCVVGTGRAGMVHAENLRWHVPHARLVAVVDEDADAGLRAAAALDLEHGSAHTRLSDALASPEVQAVVVATPTPTHARLVSEAAESGRHVLCEKPMALTLEECDQMLRVTKQAEVVLQMGFMRRFDPSFVAAKEQIAAGDIGEPIMVRSVTRGPGLPPPWAQDPSSGLGMLAEVNSHDFDTVRWLGGGEVVSVYARAGAMKAPELVDRYPGFYDTAAVLVELDNQVLGLIDGVCPAEYGYDARAEVVGTRGMLSIGAFRGLSVARVTAEEGVTGERFSSWKDRFREAYRREATHFVQCVREGQPPQVDGTDGRAALEAVLAAARSITEGFPVQVPAGA